VFDYLKRQIFGVPADQTPDHLRRVEYATARELGNRIVAENSGWRLWRVDATGQTWFRREVLSND